MSEIEKHIMVQARRFEFGRVHHYRDAEGLYEKDSDSDECFVALGRLCIQRVQFALMKKRTDTLARLRRAAASSEPSFLRKLAIYLAYLNGGCWNHESINLIYLAFQKDDNQARYIMSNLLEQSGDVVMKDLSLPIADRDILYLECLQRSVRLGCLEASCDLGCYYCAVGWVEDGVRILTRAAERGCFPAFDILVKCCRSIGSEAYCVDMDALLSHAKRLACDMNDTLTAGYLADYLADAERGSLVDRVAALRFQRRSLGRRPSEHAYVVFGDRRWERRRAGFVERLLPFLRDDYLLTSQHSHFRIVGTSSGLQDH